MMEDGFKQTEVGQQTILENQQKILQTLRGRFKATLESETVGQGQSSLRQHDEFSQLDARRDTAV